MVFVHTLGKLFFPNLYPDQRRGKMNLVILVAAVILACGGTMVATIVFFYNKH